MFYKREDTRLLSASQNTVREHGYMHTGLSSASQNTVREHGYMHTGLPSASQNTVRWLHAFRQDDSTHTAGKTWMRIQSRNMHGCLSWRNHAAYIQSILIQ